MSPQAAHKPHGSAHRRSVALFGGTFDPVHSGHIAVAQAAEKRFHLDAVYFVPSSRPPHKSKPALTPFLHRYTMVALACAGYPDFHPSLAEAPADGAAPHVFEGVFASVTSSVPFPETNDAGSHARVLGFPSIETAVM